jgi:hypothetical protein
VYDGWIGLLQVNACWPEGVCIPSSTEGSGDIGSPSAYAVELPSWKLYNATSTSTGGS